MTLLRRPRETQLSFVGRMLIEHGEVRVYDLLWDSAYEGGGKTSVTRGAAVIHTLRHDFGWDIVTLETDGAVARYVLRDRPDAPKATPKPEPVVPAWAQGWRCVSCGGPPQREVETLLGQTGRAPCAACRMPRIFTRAA